MANHAPGNWKLLANIGVVALLVFYYLYSQDISAALAVTIGLGVYSVAWLVKSLRANRQAKNEGKDHEEQKHSKNDVETDQ